MARVFDAFDERLERPAAVKILRAETRALPGMRERFQQEALIAARLVHPRIVAVLDFGEDHASSFLVMERLPGATLRDEIVARGPLSPQRVQLVMAETLAALGAAHSRGVLHRDIKPSNILLEQDGHTKITDFGIAKSFDVRTNPVSLTDDMTITGVVLGTPGYLAPERRLGHPATVQSDLYSVGAVMVEAMTGQRLGQSAVPPERLPAPFCDVARRALAPDPRDRFSSANEMLHACRGGAGGGRPARPSGAVTTTATVPMRPGAGTAVLTPPGPVRQRGKEKRSRVPRRLVLATMSMVVLVATLLVLYEREARPGSTPASVASQHVARPQTQALTSPSTSPSTSPRTSPSTSPTTTSTTDAESSAISTLATSIADGGFPGDAALANALESAAAQPPGAGRESAAQQALSLAGVLLDSGSITWGQYQDVVGVLRPTGATTTTTTTAPAPVPSFHVPFFRGRGHDRGRGDGAGGQG
jgi:eukaryotic-like serine/threonine-protein kinase